MSLDGYYGFVYCGAIDLGIGAFVVEDGQVHGVDFAGGRYTGTVRENPDGTITVKAKFTVLPTMRLVQGVAQQDLPYDKFIDWTCPPLFGDGQPLNVSSPPVTIMVKKLPADTALPQALGLVPPTG